MAMLPMAVLATMLQLAACSDAPAYLHSVDVDSSEWTSADTLFFPIRVDAEAKSYSPLERNFPYCLSLIVRYDIVYPMPDAKVCIQLSDGSKPLSEISVVDLPLADEDGFPDGERVGTLCLKTVDVPSAFYLFPDSGDYQLRIWPDSIASHIVSLTATLE